MDYQNISLAATRQTNTFGIVGDGIWYVDSTPADGSVDTRIKVTPQGGNTIVLKPGQHFRLENGVTTWTIASMTGAENFTGNVIIGNGDFGDDVLSVKLDASFANNVTVMNTGANRVPVSLDTAQALGVTVIPKVYTGKYFDWATLAANTPITLVAPAANVNGIVLLDYQSRGNIASNGHVALLTKASAPTTWQDGFPARIFSNTSGGDAYYSNTDPIHIPAGQGLYLISNAGDATLAFRSIHWIVL